MCESKWGGQLLWEAPWKWNMEREHCNLPDREDEADSLGIMKHIEFFYFLFSYLNTQILLQTWPTFIYKTRNLKLPHPHHQRKWWGSRFFFSRTTRPRHQNLQTTPQGSGSTLDTGAAVRALAIKLAGAGDFPPGAGAGVAAAVLPAGAGAVVCRRRPSRRAPVEIFHEQTRAGK